MCDACTDPQLCRDTNSCWCTNALRQQATDEMTRIAQENGEYESNTSGQNGAETDDKPLPYIRGQGVEFRALEGHTDEEKERSAAGDTEKEWSAR